MLEQNSCRILSLYERSALKATSGTSSVFEVSYLVNLSNLRLAISRSRAFLVNTLMKLSVHAFIFSVSLTFSAEISFGYGASTEVDTKLAILMTGLGTATLLCLSRSRSSTKPRIGASIRY